MNRRTLKLKSCCPRPLPKIQLVQTAAAFSSSLRGEALPHQRLALRPVTRLACLLLEGVVRASLAKLKQAKPGQPQHQKVDALLGGRFGYLSFCFCSERGRRSLRRREGGGWVWFLLRIRGGEGVSRRGGRGGRGREGGWLNIFFSGPKFPPSLAPSVPKSPH